MHISDGVLPVPVLLSGAAAAAAGTWCGLRHLAGRDLAKLGFLASALYLAPLIQIPLGPTSVHLVLNGLTGLLLGWAAFPVILAALVLHATMLQTGGLAALGVNTTIMALPAVLAHRLFARTAAGPDLRADAAAFAGGLAAVAGAAVLAGAALAVTSASLLPTVYALAAAHLPDMAVEGLLCFSALRFIKLFKPELLAPRP